MLIERTSKFSGITRVVDLPVTLQQLERFESGMETIQDIFPNLNADEREFIKTGITAEEWDQMFAETTI
jgi:hypothetical protein